ncbi:MAG: hypothetical protein Q9163_000084 [Psora crenata]
MASVPAVKAEPIATEDEALARKPYRSYKKKFLKLRHAFRDKMRESNTLCDDERRAKQIAWRLQEQNDQLLDLLLDINDSNKIPPYLRYDLSDGAAVPELMPDRSPSAYQDLQNPQLALHEAKLELQSGHIDLQSYKEQEAALSAIIGRSQSLNNLCKTSHSTLQCVPPDLVPADLTENTPTNYLSPTHEEEYLSAVDAYLDAPHPVEQPLPQPPPKPTERDREREIQLRNPMSVFNWLSHHRPKVFLDDDPSHDKPAKVPRRASPKPPGATQALARSNVKREKAGALLPKPEEEVLDEDGFVTGAIVEEGGGSGRKRKRGQEDDAYRPKGGGSKKRKRASTKTSTGVSGETAAKKLEGELDDA